MVTSWKGSDMNREDLTGKRFGALTAVRPVSSSETKDHRPGWFVRCDCGREKVVNGSNLRRGLITSCGCHIERGKRRSAAGNPKLVVDFTGQTFFELTAVLRVRGGEWLFRCSCGKEIVAKTATVKSGKIRSCGHILSETARDKIDKDGQNVAEFYDGTIVSRLRNIVNSPEIHGVQKIYTVRNGVVYSARLCLRKKQISLGRFSDYQSAAAARKAAEQLYYVPIIEEWDKLHPERKDSE